MTAPVVHPEPGDRAECVIPGCDCQQRIAQHTAVARHAPAIEAAAVAAVRAEAEAESEGDNRAELLARGEAEADAYERGWAAAASAVAKAESPSWAHILQKRLERAEAARDEARAEACELTAAHELMATQFRIMQQEKEHGWREADTWESRHNGLLQRVEEARTAMNGTGGVGLIAAERQRQIKAEGWTPEHDAEHADDSLALAAVCYATPQAWRPRFWRDGVRLDPQPTLWPWGLDAWKPTPSDRIRELVKAGALIAAEIDRLLGQQ